MGFRTGYRATVWSVEDVKGLTKVRLSTSRKNKDTGEYEQDFSGFCLFAGTAKAKAEKLRERDRIVLGDIDVTTKYDREKNCEYVNYTVFDFEPVTGATGGSAPSRPAVSAPPVDNPVEGDTDEEELPF